MYEQGYINKTPTNGGCGLRAMVRGQQFGPNITHSEILREQTNCFSPRLVEGKEQLIAVLPVRKKRTLQNHAHRQNFFGCYPEENRCVENAIVCPGMRYAGIVETHRDPTQRFPQFHRALSPQTM